MKKNYKYRIFPTKKQEKSLLATLEVCRLNYNKILETRIQAYKEEKKTLNKYATNGLIKQWAKENKPAIEVHSQILQNVSERVDLAFKAFFRRCKQKGEKVGFPRWKQYGRYDSFTFPQTGFTVEEDRLKLSKIGHIKIKLHREVQGKIKRLTIQRKGSGKWFAVFSIELSNLNITNNYPAVGIDLGLKEFAVLSNGDKVKRERFFKEEGKNLAKAQRKMSKLERDSKEGKRQTKTLCKIHERITNKRSNFTHQLSFKLANTYGKICIENLDIKGMLEKKNIKVNGKEVKATKTHKSISDVAWNQFVQQLVYKVEYTGGQVIKVNPKDTTKKCSACGKITSKELSDRTHECNWCKLIMDRDLNASKNILRIGMDSLRNRDIPIEAPIHLGYGSIH